MFHLIETAFQMNHRVKPDKIQHLGSYPEEDPTHFIYEAQFDNEVEHYVVQVNNTTKDQPGSLIIGRITSEEELDAIKLLKSGPSDNSEEQLQI